MAAVTALKSNSDTSSAMTVDFVHLLPDTSETDSLDHTQKGIVKSHHVSREVITACMQPDCNKVFTLSERGRHCPRCGGLFCRPCLQYRRRLNNLAKLDPQGKLYRVCSSCFDEGTELVFGLIRSHFDSFQYYRKCALEEKIKHQIAPRMSMAWRLDMDINRESKRLIDGFRDWLRSSGIKQTFMYLETMLTIPYWQKSSLWNNGTSAGCCRNCGGSVGLRKKKRSCRLCGTLLCRSCSKKDLLLYVPDEIKDVKYSQPQLAIIRVAGCPEKEPSLSVLLNVCTDCRQQMVDIQLTKLKQDEEQETKQMDIFQELMALESNMVDLKKHILSNLAELEEALLYVDDVSGVGPPIRDEKPTVAALIRAQITVPMFVTTNWTFVSKDELTAYFTDFNNQYERATHLIKFTTSEAQKVLMSNFLRSKRDFYLENTYRSHLLRQHVHLLQTVKHKNLHEFFQTYHSCSYCD